MGHRLMLAVVARILKPEQAVARTPKLVVEGDCE
jgi:hypothetical protein